MKKQLTRVFALLLLTLTIGAQDTLSSFSYFNRIFETDTSNLSSSVGIVNDAGYSILEYNVIQNTETILRRLDSTGVEIVHKQLVESSNCRFCLTGAVAQQIDDSSIVLVDCYDKVGGSNFDIDIHFFKTSLDGELINSSIVASTGAREIPYGLKSLSDGNFLVLGSIQDLSGGDARFYLAKIDSEGNTLWQNSEVGGDVGGSAAAFSAIEFENGNYLVSGGAFFTETNYDYFFVEYSSLGEVVSQFNLGSNNEECAASITSLSETEALFSACTKLNGISKMSLGIMNPQTKTISWEKTFNPFQDAYGFRAGPIVSQAGQIVGFSDYKNEEGWDQPVFLRFNHTGELQITKPISPNLNKHVYVHDMRLTSDGGYLITGYEHFPGPQRSWVLKIDSLGNYCQLGTDSTVYVIDTTTGIGILNDSFIEKQLTISPNPASDRITIKTAELISTVRIFDLNGRLLQQENEASFSVSGLPAGIVLVEITLRSGAIHREKLIIKH